MKAFEIYFDGLYLAFVIFIGIRMLLLRNKNNLILGSMTLLLGLGDAFHLIPRMISHSMENGFILNANALFFGTRISAITMSVFYLLFYIYISKEIDNKNKSLDLLMGGLFIARLVGVFVSFNKSNSVNIIANIPFVLMGLLDIILLYKYRDRKDFKNLYIYVFFSFFFYLSVVLLKEAYPTVGMLMMPKTVMYVMIVVKLYSNIKGDFEKRSILEFAIAYLFTGILAGAVYRELGKIYPLAKPMALVHTHLIILGFVLPSIFYLLAKDSNLSKDKPEKLMRLYNFGIYFSLSGLFLHGLTDPYTYATFTKVGLISISGLGHILLTLSLILTSKSFLKTVSE